MKQKYGKFIGLVINIKFFKNIIFFDLKINGKTKQASISKNDFFEERFYFLKKEIKKGYFISFSGLYYITKLNIQTISVKEILTTDKTFLYLKKNKKNNLISFKDLYFEYLTKNNDLLSKNKINENFV